MTAEHFIYLDWSKLTLRLSALMGLLAVFGMLSLAIVHDSSPHTHHMGHIVDMEHHHGHSHHHDDGPADEAPESADLVHAAMHAVFSTVFPISSPLVSALMPVGVFRWVVEPADDVESLQPNRILRPPRG